VVLALAAATALLVPACGKQAGPAATNTTTTTLATTTTTTVVPTTTTTAATPSPAPQLAAFIDAANALDAKLKAAAAAINGAGPPWPMVSGSVAAAVQAADVDALARTIPAGMPDALRTKTFVVYSELVSRRYAMNEFAFTRDAVLVEEQPFLLRSLGFGHEAAVRFPADVAALAALAHATPPFAAAPASSHDAAEVALTALFVRKVNGGCGNTGGSILTALPAISWQPGDNLGQHFDGRINDVPFVAVFRAGTWDVQIWAC